MPDKDKGGEPGKANDTLEQLNVDGKVVTTEDVKNLLDQQASLTQESQKIAALRDAATKYGMSPEDYVKQAEGTFGVIADLMKEGVIDEKGKPIKEKSDPNVAGDDSTVKGDGHLQQQQQQTHDPRLDTLMGKIDSLIKHREDDRKDLDNMLKFELRRDIMTKHSELDERDANVVLQKFDQNPHKSVWDHAKDIVEAKKDLLREEEERYAKKFGIDIEQYRKRNEQNVQGDGDGVAAILGERKIAFKHRVKQLGGPDSAMTPRQATEEFLKKQQRGQ